MRYLVFGILLFISTSLLGQRILQPKLMELDLKGVVYKHEWSVDFRFMEQGMSLAYNKTEIKTYYKSQYYQFEIGYTKDPREKKQSRTYTLSILDSANSFVFGKQNSVINVRGGIGFKRYLSEKAKRKGLAVGYTYAFGPSLAVLKPYYLKLEVESQDGLTNVVEQKYSEDIHDTYLNINKIQGASKFWTGIDELNVIPGLQGKLASHFAFGAFDKYVRAVEAGIIGELFIKKVPLMVETENVSNKPYFVRFYISLQLGVRKN